MPRPRRTFAREFKVQAVKLVTEQGHSHAEAARRLGVRENQIRSREKLLAIVIVKVDTFSRSIRGAEQTMMSSQPVG